MLHECLYCNTHYGIQAFADVEDDVICISCYAEARQELSDALVEVGILPTKQEDLPF
jgi:hypothetical protein